MARGFPALPVSTWHTDGTEMSETIMTAAGAVTIGKTVVTISMNADVIMPNGYAMNVATTWAHASREGVTQALAKAVEVFRREWDRDLEASAAANAKGR